MPSYIGHITCAHELIKKLKLNEEDKTKFIIGTLLPDIKQVDIDLNIDEFINKNRIQKSKRITHFRKNTNFILEYPHCRLFLEKYEKETKEHIETLAYFFHLYTDYYYFKYFLPTVISFYTKDLEEIEEKDNLYYVKINKNNKLLKARTFFSKLNEQSLYKEYYRSNYYLINKYNLKIDIEHLREYLKNNNFNCYVEEINMNKIQDVFNKIDRINKYQKQEELLIFEEKKLDKFVKDVVSSFCEKYNYILDNF